MSSLLANYGEEFNACYSEVKTIMLENCKVVPVKYVEAHLEKVISYNVPHGKRMRGLLVQAAFDLFSTTTPTREQRRLALFAGWAIEIMQTAFLIHDDIVDKSILRRNKPCWYSCGDTKAIPMIAINDGLFLYLSIFQLLKSVFKEIGGHDAVYTKIRDLFEETGYVTCLGQTLDILTPVGGDCSVEDGLHSALSNIYTEQSLDVIYKKKTAFYSFYVPVACGMILASVENEQAFDIAKTILIKMGCFFQMQDDYLDIYGNVKQTGKIGTDIPDGKCAWPIVMALKFASPDQKHQLMANYGKPEEESIDVVLKIFDELDIQGKYMKEEMLVRDEIVQLVEKYCTNAVGKNCNNSLPVECDRVQLPKELFLSLLDFLFKRQA